MSNFLNLSKFSIRHSGQSYPSVKLVVFVKTLKFVKNLKLSNFTYQLDLLNLHIRLF